MTMLYRINAGSIPGDNWIQDLEIGGGQSFRRSVSLY